MQLLLEGVLGTPKVNKERHQEKEEKNNSPRKMKSDPLLDPLVPAVGNPSAAAQQLRQHSSPRRSSPVTRPTTRNSTRTGSSISKRLPASPGGGSPASTGAGRTPQTRRKELVLSSNERNSPGGSPRNVARNSPSTTTKRAIKPSSQDDHGSSGQGRKRANRPSLSGAPPFSGGNGGGSSESVETVAMSVTAAVEDEEQRKFKELWGMKTIEQGMIRVPTGKLQDLIHKDSLETFFDLEEKPVAR